MSDSLQPHGLSATPGSSVHGILQARLLEWLAIPFFKWSSQPRDWTWVPCLAGRFFTVWDTREAPLIFIYTCKYFLSDCLVEMQSQSVQFSSVAQSCLTLCDSVDCSNPGFPVHHQVSELAQLMSHWVGDAIQPSHHLSSPSPPAFNLSQHQGLFQWVCSHLIAKIFQLQLQHQSCQCIHKGAKAEDMGKGPIGSSVTVPFHFLLHKWILELGWAMEITSSKLYPFNGGKKKIHTHNVRVSS